MIKTTNDLLNMKITSYPNYEFEEIYKSGLYKIRRENDNYFTIVDDELIRGELRLAKKYDEDDNVIPNSDFWYLDFLEYEEFETLELALNCLIEAASTNKHKL